MGKIKKGKETTKPDLTKVSNKKTLKPKKIVKAKQLEKKIKSPTQKLEKPTKDKKKAKGPTPDVEQQFSKAVLALLQYEEKYSSNELFTKEKPIFLQIDSIKIPICPNRQLRIQLRHTLLTDKQEVCLIVPDLRRGRRIDHEPTIEHYEDLFRTKNIKTVKRILPMRQLKEEYGPFELKRRLCGYYDFFLAAGKISAHANHILGQIFHEKRKTPIPINMDAPNLAETIDNSLKKVNLHIHPKGSSFVVQFGHSEMTAEQLTDNLKDVVNKLVSDFPGGWANIRSLHVKTEKSISIPVYYTLKSSNEVNVPVVKPVRPKLFEKVTGELTTKDVGTPIVTVHPSGRVEYKKRSIGVSKNQLRKIRQGEIQKRSAKMRATQQKLRAKKKLKAAAKNETVKTEITTFKIKPKQETGETIAKKQKKNKNKKKKAQTETPVKQEKIKTETKQQKKKQVTKNVETNKLKKVTKPKNKKPAGGNLQKTTKTVKNNKTPKVKKVKTEKKKQKKVVNAA